MTEGWSDSTDCHDVKHYSQNICDHADAPANKRRQVNMPDELIYSFRRKNIKKRQKNGILPHVCLQAKWLIVDYFWCCKTQRNEGFNSDQMWSEGKDLPLTRFNSEACTNIQTLSFLPTNSGVPKMFLNSFPALIGWAMPKSISLILGLGAFLSSSMIFSGWKRKEKRLQINKERIQSGWCQEHFFCSTLWGFDGFSFVSYSTQTRWEKKKKVSYGKLRQTADLQVKVSDAFGVKVVNAVQDLLEKLCGLLLSQRLLLSQEVEQLSAGHQLQDQDHVRLVLEDVVERDDVAVLDLPQDVDFALDLLAAHPSPAGRQPPLFDELGRVLVARALLLALTDDGKLSTAERKDKSDVYFNKPC